MQIRIGTSVEPTALKQFLEERSLRVPVFFDKNSHIVLDINQRNRAHAIRVIDWLLAQ